MIEERRWFIFGAVLMVVLIGLMAGFTNLTGFVVLGIGNVTECGELASAGTYVLNQSVNSSGTCFTIQADNVVLDCRNNNMNYSEVERGFGVDNSAGHDGLTIKNCVIRANPGVGSDNYGIFFSSDVQNSFVLDNQITTGGISNNSGVVLDTGSFNNISGNTISSSGSGFGNNGIYISGSSNSNFIGINTISPIGSSGTHGILLVSNSVGPSNNEFVENIISSVNGVDLNLSGTLSSGIIKLVNQGVADYDFGREGGLLKVENTDFGFVRFLDVVNGSGVNLNGAVSISSNLVSIDSSTNSGLNVRANLTLKELPTKGVWNLSILRDGIKCVDCYAFTSLKAGTIVFNVSGEGDYKLNWTDVVKITNSSVVNVTNSSVNFPKTFVVKEVDLEIGYALFLNISDKVNFTFNGERHLLKVISVSSNKTTVEIDDVSQRFSLGVGESKQVDLNDDKIMDFSVSVVSINGDSTELFLQVIVNSGAPSTLNDSSNGEDEVVFLTSDESEGVGFSFSSVYVYSGIGIFLVLGLVVLLFFIFNHGKKNSISSGRLGGDMNYGTIPKGDTNEVSNKGMSSKVPQLPHMPEVKTLKKQKIIKGDINMFNSFYNKSFSALRRRDIVSAGNLYSQLIAIYSSLDVGDKRKVARRSISLYRAIIRARNSRRRR